MGGPIGNDPAVILSAGRAALLLRSGLQAGRLVDDEQ
jgi:hypothetical protein